MNTRRYAEDSRGDASAITGDNAKVYLKSIRDKLIQNKVKIETVIERCRLFDENGDNVIHADDLIDALFDLVPRHTFNKRELQHLVIATTHGARKGHVAYLKLPEVLNNTEKNNNNSNRVRTSRRDRDDLEERWLDDQELVPEERWATQRGSVGEWLLTAGCASERSNFKDLVSCLEVFERESGMRIEQTEQGFIIPLGPNLRATLNFSMHR
jgi:hypothetical protein